MQKSLSALACEHFATLRICTKNDHCVKSGSEIYCIYVKVPNFKSPMYCNVNTSCNVSLRS